MKFYSHADKMRDYCIIYFVIILFFWTLNATDAIRRRNEKSQQTFVVRYKNGEQTIPVTVVLDDKKQTEYVINMSPRTHDKSVTLYDFKQRTIAYKDLTNRECFLGRLTDETLKHEIDVLTEVQNPIDSSPKVLSLVPHKSALTPTEIRNIAGQKTAVFCRKMNTWLIMPQGSHNILKRAVEEVEERSYSRHGFHTVKYAHHGHETRRRYRKPSTASTHSSRKNEPPSELPRRRFDLNNKNPSFENNVTTDLLQSEKFYGSRDEVHKKPELTHYNSLFLPETNFKNENNSKNSDENINLENFYLEDTKLNDHSRHSSDLNSFKNNVKNKEIVAKINDHLDSLSNRQSENYQQFSEWDPLLQPPTFPSPTMEIDISNKIALDSNYPLNQTRNIETEGLPSHEISDIPEGRSLSGDSSEDYTENPDVLINILENPKIFKKFETIDHVQDNHETLIQPNEDVHDIFEGFHNFHSNLTLPDEKSSFNFESLNGSIHQITDSAPGNHLKIFDSEISSFESQGAPSYSDDIQTVKTFRPTPITDFNTEASDIFTTTVPEYGSDKFNGHENGLGYSINKNIKYQQRWDQTMQENNYPTETLPIKAKLVNPEPNSAVLPFRNKEHLDYATDFRPIKNSLHSNMTIQRFKSVPELAVTPPGHQVRFQNVFRNYKPDEIVIDIAKIPTERPPDSTSNFLGRDYSLYQSNKPETFSNNTKLNKNLHGNVYNFLTKYRHYENNNYSRPTINNSRMLTPARHVETSRRKNPPNLYSPFSSSNLSPKQSASTFVGYPTQLDALPPGVSLHPRHPQAPYADMLRTNMLHTLPQKNTQVLTKLHRQRHKRRKGHKPNTCCRSNMRSSACCSLHTRRGIQINSSSKSQEVSQYQLQSPTLHPRRGGYQPLVLMPKEASLPMNLPIRRGSVVSTQRKIQEDKDRCQKEKMCRTLFESTRKVMVCRNVDVEGC